MEKESIYIRIKMIIKQINNINIAIIEDNEKADNIRDISDMMANAYYSECSGLIIKKENLPEDFFDLKTKFAGEVLQKFSNYKMKLAIIGDFSEYTSKSLHDFIYECNNGNLVFFKSAEDEGMSVLTS
jgi:hypothetical protein